MEGYVDENETSYDVINNEDLETHDFELGEASEDIQRTVLNRIVLILLRLELMMSRCFF
jgi:hypothetical protein